MKKKLKSPLKKKTRNTLKGKKIECFNYEGLGHVSSDCPSPKDINKSMQATWSNTNSNKNDKIPQTNMSLWNQELEQGSLRLIGNIDLFII